MTTRNPPPSTFWIGGREVSELVAALIAQDSDRLGLLPGEVADVVIPDPAPTHVLIAGFSLSIEAGAKIARVADEQGKHPRKLLADIVVDYTKARDRRARRRDTKPTLDGAWQRPSDPSRRGGDNSGDT